MAIDAYIALDSAACMRQLPLNMPGTSPFDVQSVAEALANMF